MSRVENQRTGKIFVGGLAGTVTNYSMRVFFTQYGKVIDATVMNDRETGRSKGFGFVTFQEAFPAEQLVAIRHLDMEGKMVR